MASDVTPIVFLLFVVLLVLGVTALLAIDEFLLDIAIRPSEEGDP